MVGRRVGNYKIVSVLGRGGASTVYRAQHVVLPRTDAVKILRKEAAGDAEQMSRFIDEARALGHLRHPGVVSIFDCGALDGGAYLAMELLHGETLEKRIEREGALPLAFVAEVVAQLGAALDVVHAAGIVHRDIKPANLFLAQDDDQPFGVRVKVLDFGVAKHSRPTGGRVTEEGAIIGTPEYMSPEQCIGSRIDRRADIYNFGLAIFEMVTGRPPFSYDTLGEVLEAHLTEAPPPPWQLRPDLPMPMAAAIARALSKDPAARFGTAGELAAAFTLPHSDSAQKRMEARTEPMGPVEERREAEPLLRPTVPSELVVPRHRAPAVAVACALMFVLGFVLFFALRPARRNPLEIAAPPPPPPPQPVAATVEPPGPPPRETYVPAPPPPRPTTRRPRPPRAPAPVAAPQLDPGIDSPPPRPPRARADLKNPFGD